MSKIPQIGLVGAGVMGSHHARVISSSDIAELGFIVDPREDVGKAAAAKFNTLWYPELPDLSGTQGVIVAAATEAHFDVASAVLDQGTALLVEKPIAASLKETEQILAMAERESIPFTCGFLERYNPAIITARQLVRDPIHFTSTRHSPYAPRIKTGVAWDLLVHDVDLAVQFFGETPTQVDAHLGFFHPLSDSGAEDVSEAILSFGENGLAHCSASRVGQRKIRHVSVYELDRLIEIDLLRRDVTIYNHVTEELSGDKGHGYKQQTIIEIPELITSKEPLVSQLENFVALIGGLRDIDDERESLLAPHQVIEKVKNSTIKN